MRLSVEKLPEDGESQVVPLAEGWANEAARLGSDGEVRALEGELRVARIAGRVVTVEPQFELFAERDCDRCGQGVELRITVREALSYAPPAEAVDLDTELDAAELDVGWYVDDHLDLADVVCEAVGLALPSRVVCPDVSACDERTRILLGSQAGAGHSAFAGLEKFGKN